MLTIASQSVQFRHFQFQQWFEYIGTILSLRGLATVLMLTLLHSDHPFDAEQSGLLQAINPTLALDAADSNYELRSLIFKHSHIQLIVRWQEDERTFPGRNGMATINETTLLIEALPTMNALRNQLGNRQHVVESQLYLSSGFSRVICWRTTRHETLCAATSLDDHRSTQPSGANVVVLLLLIAGCFLARWIHAHLQFRSRFNELLHDIRLPLANLLLYSSLVQRRPDSFDRYQGVLKTETQRIQGLLNTLAVLVNPADNPVVSASSRERASPVANHLVADRATSTPIAHIRQLAISYEQKLENANCQLELQLENCPTVFVNLTVLGRILHNLLDNCTRHAPGRSIRLTTRGSDKARMVVELNSATQGQAIVFEPGTGLNSCARLAKQEGWQWSCQSSSDWLTWRLEIPLTDSKVTPAMGVLCV